jgi:hypothetical protein
LPEPFEAYKKDEKSQQFVSIFFHLTIGLRLND